MDKNLLEFIKMCRIFNVILDVWFLFEWTNWLILVILLSIGKGVGWWYDIVFFMCVVDYFLEVMYDNNEIVDLKVINRKFNDKNGF